jgi:hypothetical protein
VSVDSRVIDSKGLSRGSQTFFTAKSDFGCITVLKFERRTLQPDRGSTLAMQIIVKLEHACDAESEKGRNLKPMEFEKAAGYER